LSPTLKAHLALFSVALIYGANYSIAKVVMNNGYIEPLGFILMRAASATVLFWIFHCLFISEKVKRKDFPLLMLCGLLGVAINQMFFFSGLKLTQPINAALIMMTSPIVVIIVAPFITGERITSRKLLGIAIGSIGSVFLITYGKTIQFDKSGLLGDLMILVNAVSYSLYLVIVKKLMLKYHPITVVKWVFTFGLIVIIPFGLQQVTAVDWSSFDINIWLAFFYVLLFTTFFAYLLNAVALKTVNSSVVAMYIYLQPLIATVVALAMSKDELSTAKVVAGLFIYLGVYLVSSQPEKKRLENDVTKTHS